MLLSAFLAFTAFGFGVWLLGRLMYQADGSQIFIAISAIGAVLIMVTGGAVALTDVEQPTGEVVVNDYREAANVTDENRSEIVYVNNQSTTTQTTTRVSITDQFGTVFGQLGLGGLELIIGALLLMSDLEKLSD